MKNRKREILILIILVLLLFVINYRFLDSFLNNFFNEKDRVIVERIVDGDTIIANGSSIRLLGINTPERGEKYYNEAKKFLEELILNKTVFLEYGKERKDKYNRTLAYIFLKEENINVKLIEEGFANYYFPSGKDSKYIQFTNSWKDCLIKNKNLCQKSEDKCAECISIKFEKKTIILKNACSFDCNIKNWILKNEGRKKFIFPETIIEDSVVIRLNEENANYPLNWEESIPNPQGDTFFLRDSDSKIVTWKLIDNKDLLQ